MQIVKFRLLTLVLKPSKNINLNKNISLNIDLIDYSTDIDEVTIVATETLVERTQTSIVEVPVQQIKNIPALLGDRCFKSNSIIASTIWW